MTPPYGPNNAPTQSTTTTQGTPLPGQPIPDDNAPEYDWSLVLEYERLIHFLVNKFVWPDEDRDELAQLAMVEVARTHRKIRQADKPSAFIGSVVRFRTKNWRRDRAAQPEPASLDAYLSQDDEGDLTLGDLVPDPDVDVAAEGDQYALIPQVVEAMRALPEPQRSILFGELNGHSEAIVAEWLGLNPDDYDAAHERGLVALREALGEVA